MSGAVRETARAIVIAIPKNNPASFPRRWLYRSSETLRAFTIAGESEASNMPGMNVHTSATRTAASYIPTARASMR